MYSEMIIKSIRPRTVGDGIDIILSEKSDGRELKLSLPDSAYLEWHTRIGSPVSEGELDELRSDAEFFAAKRKGEELLEFGDMTRAMLVRKLRQKGFPAPAAERAAKHLSDTGEINEERFARTALRYYLEKKHLGRSRIESEMYGKGFGRDTVERMLEEVPEEAFVAACRTQIERLFGGELPEEPGEYRKAMAALYRRGFNRQIITAAVESSL